MSVKKAVIASAVALAVSGAIAEKASAASDDKEKCYGVVKAGHNDCADATKKHSCMGQAMTDGGGEEWVAVPAGLCERLVGGSLEPVAGGEKMSCDAKSTCAGKEDGDMPASDEGNEG